MSESHYEHEAQHIAGLRPSGAKVPPAVPDGFKLVPVDFLRGFYSLAHNYALKAQAPEYYHGVERDAFSAAYARCGSDLAKLRALLADGPL